MTFCQSCGSPIADGVKFCPSCGKPAMQGAPPQPQVVFQPAPQVVVLQPAYANPMMSAMQRSSDIQTSRTKNGCLLFAIGFLLAVFSGVGGIVACIGLFGYLLVLVGGILIVLGRTAYTPRHQNFAILAVVLVILAIVVAIALAFVVAAGLISAVNKVHPNPDEVKGPIMLLCAMPLITGSISGLATVLLGHELTSPTGRKLLYVGYILSLLAGVVLIVMGLSIVNDIPSYVNDPTNARYIDAVNKIYGYAIICAAIGIIGAILAFIAYYWAYQRVASGEVYRDMGMPQLGVIVAGPQPVMVVAAPQAFGMPQQSASPQGFKSCASCGTQIMSGATLCPKCGMPVH